jgi:hypothetical protein
LPGSLQPDDLRQLGYDVREAGEGERILATSVTELLTCTSSGALEPLVEGSTMAVEVHHADIVAIRRFCFTIA